MEKRKIVTSARGIDANVNAEDERIEGSLRPRSLDKYIGQKKIKESLKIYIEAAKKRGECLDHLLFYGPPGLGKTTLAGIIASEMGVNIKITSGPAIEKPGDMAAILNNLRRMMFSLLMRYTDLTDRWKRFFIRQWRITPLIL